MNARPGALGETRTLLEQDDPGEAAIVEVPEKHGGDTAFVVPVLHGACGAQSRTCSGGGKTGARVHLAVGVECLIRGDLEFAQLWGRDRSVFQWRVVLIRPWRPAGKVTL